MRKSTFVFLFTFTFSLFASLCEGQYTVLHNFNGTNGSDPQGGLTLSGNVLYGMTTYGGTNNEGCVFSINTDGSNYKVLLNFNDSNGAYPMWSSLTLAGNVLYGMTVLGGYKNNGVVFSVHTDGSGYRDLHNFNDTDQGQSPRGSLTISGKVLYGENCFGGDHTNLSGNGTIFSLDTDGSQFKVLHIFNGSDGRCPETALTHLGPTLFGSTFVGGANSDGVIFAIDTDGSRFRDIDTFNWGNGAQPDCFFALSGKVLYGIATASPNDSGYIFAVDTNGKRFRDLLEFGRATGVASVVGLTLSPGGSLYGMGNGNLSPDSGFIFSVDTNGNNFKDIYDFDGINGAGPAAGGLVLSGNILYGMTSDGGVNHYGTIFSFKDAGLGINNPSPTTSSINVYPNPSNGEFTIVAKSEELRAKSIIEVYNVLGEKVYSNPFTFNNSQFTIDLSSQPNGIYFYRVIEEEGGLAGEGKLIINK